MANGYDDVGFPITSLTALRQGAGYRTRDGELGLSFNRGDNASGDGFRPVRNLDAILAAEMAEWPQTEEDRLRRVAKVEADMAKWGDTLAQMAAEHAAGMVGTTSIETPTRQEQ